MMDPLALEGWLWLARPVVASLVLLFAIAAWSMDRQESRAARAGARRRVSGAWWVEVVDPGPALALERGQRIDVPARITLGRSPDCSVVLEDPAVSALHAVVLVEDGRCLVEDMGSRNGTLLDGRPVQGRAPVVEGDEIQVGDVRLAARCD